VFLVLERDRFTELLSGRRKLRESLMQKYAERATASHTVMQRAKALAAQCVNKSMELVPLALPRSRPGRPAPVFRVAPGRGELPGNQIASRTRLPCEVRKTLQVKIMELRDE